MLTRHTSVMAGCLLAVCVVAVLTGSTMAAVEYGLAARYPGDAGIESDPSVIFTENFEEASVSELVARWEDVLRPDRMSFTTDTPAASGGSQSVSFTGSAHLYRRLRPGYDRLYVRFYAKFDPICNQVHHFVWMGGPQPLDLVSLAAGRPAAGRRRAVVDRHRADGRQLGVGFLHVLDAHAARWSR